MASNIYIRNSLTLYFSDQVVKSENFQFSVLNNLLRMFILKVTQKLEFPNGYSS